MMALTAEDVADLRRWLLAGLVVASAYVGVAAAMVQWHEPISAAEPSGAVVIEFAPEAVAAPEQRQSEAVPDKPIEKVEKKEEQQVDAKGEEQLEQEVEPKPREQPPSAETPEIAPQELPKTAALPAAPVQGTPTKPVDMKAMQTWVGEIAAAIERKKRYNMRRQQGTVEVSFTLDRQGHVVDTHIKRSSGAPGLDQEAVALLLRAQPFPPRPANGVQDEQVHLTVPIRFSLN